MVEVIRPRRFFHDWIQYDPPNGLRFQVLDGGGYSIYRCWKTAAAGEKVAEFWTHYEERPFWRDLLGIGQVEVAFHGIDVLKSSWAEAIVAWTNRIEGEIDRPIKVRIL